MFPEKIEVSGKAPGMLHITQPRRSFIKGNFSLLIHLSSTLKCAAANAEAIHISAVCSLRLDTSWLIIWHLTVWMPHCQQQNIVVCFYHYCRHMSMHTNTTYTLVKTGMLKWKSHNKMKADKCCRAKVTNWPTRESHLHFKSLYCL